MTTHDNVAEDEAEPAQSHHIEFRNSDLDDLVARACVDYLDTDVLYQEVVDHNYDNSAGLELIGNAYPREIQNATVSYKD